jgi:hypothetical protein
MTRRAGLPARVWFATFAVVLGVSCARTIELGSDQSAQSAGGTGGGGEGGTGVTCEIATCRGMEYVCGNCKDDDGDGLVDAEDPDCTGPCDHREDSLSVGIPAPDTGSCKEDCYFDRSPGSGDDGCRFSYRCDPLSIEPNFPPSGDPACSYDEAANIPGGTETCEDLRNSQPASCAEICGPLVPNGCDCFGCCELPAGSGMHVFIGSNVNGVETCTQARVTDPAACQPCTPVDSCLNECLPCETCVGRPLPLPDCDETMGEACPASYDSCGQDVVGGCGQGSYCVTGCCIPEPR